MLVLGALGPCFQTRHCALQPLLQDRSSYGAAWVHARQTLQSSLQSCTFRAAISKPLRSINEAALSQLRLCQATIDNWQTLTQCC